MPAKTRTATPDPFSMITEQLSRLDARIAAVHRQLDQLDERMHALTVRIEKLERHVL